jgi:uncharacterized BrkB/YihY/UPF0761 family membrane protein
MKKSILAPLCSALIIPGLGQIVNQEIRKGCLILGAVFLVFVAASVNLVFILKAMVSQSGKAPVSYQILERVDLLIIIGTFFLIWLYSVLDAFLRARDLEEQRGKEVTSHSILSD